MLFLASSCFGYFNNLSKHETLRERVNYKGVTWIRDPFFSQSRLFLVPSLPPHSSTFPFPPFRFPCPFNFFLPSSLSHRSFLKPLHNDRFVSFQSDCVKGKLLQRMTKRKTKIGQDKNGIGFKLDEVHFLFKDPRNRCRRSLGDISSLLILELLGHWLLRHLKVHIFCRPLHESFGLKQFLIIYL